MSTEERERAYEQIAEIARDHNIIIGAAGGVLVIGHPEEVAKAEAKRNPENDRTLATQPAPKDSDS